jgi:multidrug efflux pump subunit AcrA (membrane-fusion protein)
MGAQRKIFVRIVIVFIVVVGFAAALASALYPAYVSPNSRLWSSSLGYPSLMRALQDPIPVTVAEVQSQYMTRHLTAEGTVSYLNETPVNVEMVGMVTQISAELGSRVKTGEVLLSLDSGGHMSRIAKLDMELKRNKSEEALKDFTREQDAYNKGLIARTVLDQYQRNLEEAQIAYQRASEAYNNSLNSLSASVLGGGNNTVGEEDGLSSRMDILSPVDGTVFRQQIALGENLVRPREKVLTIGDRLVFRAAFDQRYVPWVREDQPVKIYLSAMPGRAIDGHVMRIDRRIGGLASANPADPARMSFSVWIRSEAIERDALHGMNGYCLIEQPLTALAIPDNALMRFSGREGMVMIVNAEQRIELRPVTYALSLNGWVAIEQGLQVGERVITGGQLGLRDGDKVVIR